MTYNKEEAKEQIEIEDVFNLLEFFEAEPQIFGDHIVAKTICHEGHSHKLYFYSNTKLFHCFSGDCGTFDIFELVQKKQGVDLNTAIYFVVNFLNIQSFLEEEYDADAAELLSDFNRYNKIVQIESSIKEEAIFPEIPNYIEHYPQPTILNWEKEGISAEVCRYMNIHYNPINGSILIPHYDINNRLIGIRQRTLVKEDEVYGKYRPARLQGQLCNHPLAFNLYGMNQARENIEDMKIAIVVESEKSVLQYLSYFGTKSNICVAVCGSSLSNYQFQLLMQCGIEELVIGFDKDFEEFNSDEYYQVEDKLMKIYNRFHQRTNVSFLFDKENNTLGYKNSPMDCGRDAFLKL